MPSFLIPQNPEFLDRWIAEAEQARRLVRLAASSPWQGMTPDLPPDRGPSTGMVQINGLVARPDLSSNGEVLMPDAGFDRVDAPNLPLAVSGNSNISMLAQFNRTNSTGGIAGEYDVTLLALVGGDDTTAGSTELWRLRPSTQAWQQIAGSFSAGGPPDPPLAERPAASRANLSDWAEFPAGAPNRTAYNGAITEPCFVWCNDVDRVMVYPVNTGAGTESGDFEPITDQFGGNFYAKTVEHFGGRLYFGNTSESGTRHRQRIRRTALFTADPQVQVGSGAFDVRDFSGNLLRLEKLGDVMAAYFEDGVAFIRTTDIATAPDGVQLLRERRGLLSTHSVTSVGNQEHFGIFDDGWFFLDPSGRWTEVGLTEIDGVRVTKWKDTFYNTIDLDLRERTVVSYDGRFIRIAFTANGSPENNEVWIFDPRGNRVFRDTYPVTVWGEMNRAIQAATAIQDLQGTIGNLQGSIASYGAKTGLKALHHGTPNGYVLSHNYELTTQFDSGGNLTDKNPTFSITGVLTSGGDPTTVKRARKLWVEQVHSGTGNVTMGFSGDSRDGQESNAVDFSETGAPGDVDTVFSTFNFSAANLRYFLAGNAPIRIRSIMADVEVTDFEERQG